MNWRPLDPNSRRRAPSSVSLQQQMGAGSMPRWKGGVPQWNLKNAKGGTLAYSHLGCDGNGFPGGGEGVLQMLIPFFGCVRIQHRKLQPPRYSAQRVSQIMKIPILGDLDGFRHGGDRERYRVIGTRRTLLADQRLEPRTENVLQASVKILLQPSCDVDRALHAGNPRPAVVRRVNRRHRLRPLDTRPKTPRFCKHHPCGESCCCVHRRRCDCVAWKPPTAPGPGGRCTGPTRSRHQSHHLVFRIVDIALDDGDLRRGHRVFRVISDQCHS